MSEQFKVVPYYSTGIMDRSAAERIPELIRENAELAWQAMIDAAPDVGMVAVRRKLFEKMASSLIVEGYFSSFTAAEKAEIQEALK